MSVCWFVLDHGQIGIRVLAVKDSGRVYLHLAACLITVSAFVVHVSLIGPH